MAAYRNEGFAKEILKSLIAKKDYVDGLKNWQISRSPSSCVQRPVCSSLSFDVQDVSGTATPR